MPLTSTLLFSLLRSLEKSMKQGQRRTKEQIEKFGRCRFIKTIDSFVEFRKILCEANSANFADQSLEKVRS